jgi:DNA-binding MarR family transcriptional regulator
VTRVNPPELRLAIQRLARRIRAMQADDQVTEGQRSVLFQLDHHGPQTLGSLSEREKVTPPSMNRTTNALVSAGLVTRTPAPDDARKITLDLSGAGRAFVKETSRRRSAWFTKQLATLTPEQQQILEQAAPILQKLADL